MDEQRQRNILLVEDDAIIGMNESRQLTDYGYRVRHVLKGQEAILAIDSVNSDIDLILMDIDLGKELDGTEIAKIILKDHDIPILFLSSRADREIVKKTEGITSYGYVVKNSGIIVLDASIKMAFRLHDAYVNMQKQKFEIESKSNELKFLEMRYRRLFEAAKDGILILDAVNGKIVDVNPFLIQLLGYSKDQLLEKSIWEINAFRNADYSKKLFKELQETGYARYANLPLETSDGRKVHVEFVSNVYLVAGERVIQCNIRDVEDRNRHENSLAADIDEKVSMLRELQHRTKNSFTMITSLINLRSIASDSVDTKRVLDELNLRVSSISDLYSLLYETDSFREVQLQIYANKVIDSMVQFSENVTVNKMIEGITVPAKDAATIGMILVELLSNVIKYAFPEKRNGTINIEIRKVEDKVLISVGDNGVGVGKNVDILQAKTLGLHLVRLMVNQLNGGIKLINENGTKIIITLPLDILSKI
ncbi:sensor histidine kinase [Leptospira broomii]|uniref:sensor histidine kinase n=1 Tax=Leptospira broomii TaxID=301541 RepID=UPI000287E51D|nr:PAS domain S-box protein [Leptospira broomii]